MSEWTKDEYKIAYGDTLGFMDIEMLRKAFALRDAEIKRLKSALNKYSEDEILCAKDTEIKRLNALSTCGCGDGFTAADPGRCGNCSVQDRIEIDRLKAALNNFGTQPANERLTAALAEIEHLSAFISAEMVCSDYRTAAQMRAEIDRLTEELEYHAWEISPAMAQAQIDALNKEVTRLKAELAEAKRNRCETCGAWVYSGPPCCIRCGAPNCCQMCCMIDTSERRLAEARDAWAVAISVPQMQVRVASISHAGWLMLRAALEVKA